MTESTCFRRRKKIGNTSRWKNPKTTQRTNKTEQNSDTGKGNSS
jgi:hypothetical protein